ncbi:uncharacterized protein METZ01_LOCUS516117, partial [marine metagenome]
VLGKVAAYLWNHLVFVTAPEVVRPG